MRYNKEKRRSNKKISILSHKHNTTMETKEEEAKKAKVLKKKSYKADVRKTVLDHLYCLGDKAIEQQLLLDKMKANKKQLEEQENPKPDVKLRIDIYDRSIQDNEKELKSNLSDLHIMFNFIFYGHGSFIQGQIRNEDGTYASLPGLLYPEWPRDQVEKFP